MLRVVGTPPDRCAIGGTLVNLYIAGKRIKGSGPDQIGIGGTGRGRDSRTHVAMNPVAVVTPGIRHADRRFRDAAVGAIRSLKSPAYINQASSS